MRGGSEMQFGLFGLGGYPIGKFSYADGSPLGLKPQIFAAWGRPHHCRFAGHHQNVKIDLS